MTNLTKYSATIYKEQILELLGVKGEAYITSVKWDADAEELDINVVGEKADKTFKIGDNGTLNVNGGGFNSSGSEEVMKLLAKCVFKDYVYSSDEENTNIPLAADLAKEANDLFVKNNKELIAEIVKGIKKAKEDNKREMTVILKNQTEYKAVSEIFKLKEFNVSYLYGSYGMKTTISW